MKNNTPIKLSTLIIMNLLINSFSVNSATFTPGSTGDVLDNPHRGYMLWGSSVLADGGLPDNHHQANMYHVYLPWRMVETTDQIFDWQTVEQTYLDPIISAHPNATVVLRLVADYPDGPGSGINAHYTGGDDHRDYPVFLEQPPFNIQRNTYSSCNGDGPGVAPDWNDANFRDQVTDLVIAFGHHFDGDPRISAIQVGLLGLWGEWHQSGCEAIAPDDEVKNLVKIAYDNAFTQTPLQTRYARDPDIFNVEFGFHEDFFPSFTGPCIYNLPLCSDTGDWNLEYGFTHIDPDARNNWQVSPVSGESPLTSQKNAWINDEADVTTLINDYHFSFLGPAGKHEETGNDAAMDRIANQLGYRLQLNELNIPSPITVQSTTVMVSLNNVGSAPVYHPYHLTLDWVNSNGQTIDSWVFDQALSSWLQGNHMSAQQTFNTSLPNGVYSLRAYGQSTSSPNRNLILANNSRDSIDRIILGNVTVDLTDLIFADGFD